MTSIHGHEVLNMMLNSDVGYSEKSLEQAIIAKFGGEARFHTCSAQGMTAMELVLFLAERGKFIPQQDGFTTNESKICRH